MAGCRSERAYGRRMMAAGVALALLAALLVVVDRPAVADTVPPSPETPVTVSADALPTVQIDGVVWDQVIAGDRVYVTGDFAQARPAGAASGSQETAREHILAYDIDTGALVASWAPSLNAQGRTITASPDGSRIYVGGDFTNVSGTPRNRLVALDAASGEVIDGFDANVNSAVDALQVAGDRLFVGGEFTTIGFQARSRIGSVDATTGAVESWAPSADQEVSTLVVHEARGIVVVGGRLEELNGEPYYGMGALNAVTGATRPWEANETVRNAGPNAMVSSLVTDGDVVYGSAWQFGAQGPGGNFEGSFAADVTTGEIDWLQGCRGDVYQIAEIGELIYSVGHSHDCGMVRGHPQASAGQSDWTFQYAQSFTKDRAADGRLNTYHPSEGIGPNVTGFPAPELLHWLPTFSQGSFTGAYQGPWSVTANDDYVVIGGEFPRVNGDNQQGLVRFTLSGDAPNEEGPLATGPQDAGPVTPTLTDLGPGTVRIGWTAAWDRDNERLTYEVLRGSSVIATLTQDTNWWSRLPMGIVDTTAAPGSQQSYRIRVTDPFDNVLTTSATSTTIPAGDAPERAYRDAVQSDGAVHHWRLGEPEGVVAYDWANSNDLELDPEVVRGAEGALIGDDDGSSTFPASGEIGGETSYDHHSSRSLSVEAWVRTSSTAGGRILGFTNYNDPWWNPDINNSDRHLYIADDGRLHFGVRPDGQRETLASEPGFNDGEWHHVVGTIGAAGMRLYVDGDLAASRDDLTQARDTLGAWQIGSGPLDSWPGAPTSTDLDGQIDEAAVYRGALTAQQVQGHYLVSGRTGDFPNLSPTAAFTSEVNERAASFDASGSSDQDGEIASYEWDFGDGESGTGVTPDHLYAADGSYDVTLTVTDDEGAQDSVTSEITVAEEQFPGAIAADTFSRTVSDGFGTADVGGAWSVRGGASSFSVADGVGTIQGEDAGGARAAYLEDVVVADVEVTASMALEDEPTGGGAFADLASRRVSGGNDYRVTLHFQADGAVTASLIQVVGFEETSLGAAAVPGVSYSPGDVLRVRFQVEGNSPTVLNAKVWPEGTPEPDDWTITGTDDTPEVLQGAGGLGVLLYPSASSTSLPISLSIDDYLAGPLVEDPTNEAPSAAFEHTVEALTATFDAAGSTDADGEIVAYEWDFGDGESGTGVAPEHVYAAGGTYPVVLTVTDDGGATDTVTVDVVVEDPVDQGGELSADPTAIDFGEVEIDATGQASTTLTNTGETSIEVTSGSIEGSAAFTVTSQFPIELAPDASVELELAFEPSEEGAAVATASLAHTGDNSPLVIGLSGEGISVATPDPDPTPGPAPDGCHVLSGDWDGSGDGSGSDGVGWWCDGRAKLQTADGELIEFSYGRSGDIPVVADWDGDGQDTISVIRDGTWYLNNRLLGGAAERSFVYGRVSQGDVPITGVWDFGTRDLPGIVRDREWHLRNTQSGGPADWRFVYGRLTAGDLPLVGDWRNDGRDTVGVVRDGRWLLRDSHTGGPAEVDLDYVYGRVNNGDVPLMGDWTGDGTDTPAIVRDGQWYLKDEHGGGVADRVLTFGHE